MFSFLQNLLPRLRQFSQSLDQTELFVDKPWVLLDEDGQQQTYIFRRGGELLMSLDGQVQMGSWDYIAAAQSILIDRQVDKLLLNHFFFTDALLVLARDGRPDSKFVLANRQLIPDLDVEGYLRKLEVKQKMQLKSPSTNPTEVRKTYVKTTNGVDLEFFTTGRAYAPGDVVHVSGTPAPTGRYITEKTWGVYVENGFVMKIIWPKLYKLKTGEEIIVDCYTSGGTPDINNRVYSEEGRTLPDGKYHIVGSGKVRVKGGLLYEFPFF